MDFKSRFKTHYQFIKPGIVYANVLTAAAGYLFASALHINAVQLGSLLAGLALLIIGACAANNIIDRKRDRVMKRTARRGLVTGSLSVPVALRWATIGLVGGMTLLVISQNFLTAVLAFIAYLDYVILYSIAKRTSVHSTLIGCISGALPLVAGYTAVTGKLDSTAGLLFMLMVAWQMAHFFGIALYRYDDYKKADFPVMPVRRGRSLTQRQAVAYIVLFVIVAITLAFEGGLGYLGAIGLVGAGIWWLVSVIRARRLPTDQWGKLLFLRSLVVMLGMSVSLVVGSRLL